jgi:enamine deaminase RidA (YjgF/YER057c/UK114 family)
MNNGEKTPKIIIREGNLMSSIDDKLESLGIALPAVAQPLANYVGWQRTGNVIFVSGQLPLRDGKLTIHATTIHEVVELANEARQCAINVIAQLRDACSGELSRVRQIIKITGFVAAAPDFKDHPKVINGASDLMVAVFGEKGRHARAAVGVSSLPLGATVEVEAIAEIE